ncbi:hypothetical protein [Aquariibacter albus]|uniref:DUF3806 domain-containing protein n=1 Tax=Aquariibacter albus TaxID=2759899 RepID=A0A839HWD4_9BURK|nr:hypothetical protein [Aquariibacter albus]MBB1163124.1 hypothetical protein [Aquariibacter albus]
MKITETPVDSKSLADLTSFANGILEMLPKRDPDSEFLDVIDQTLYDWQQSGANPVEGVEEDDLIYALGVLWGNHLVKEHAWRWADLTFHEFNDWTGRAVVSESGSLSILPFAYIRECLDGEDEVKISAVPVALRSNVIPEFPPGTFENVMHGLQRIVPRG